MLSYFDGCESQTHGFGGAVRGVNFVRVRKSKFRILGSESVNNPERPFFTLIHSCQRRVNVYLAERCQRDISSE